MNQYKNKRRQTMSGHFGLAALFFILTCVIPASALSDTEATPAPDFLGYDPSGLPIKLSILRDKSVAVLFFTSMVSEGAEHLASFLDSANTKYSDNRVIFLTIASGDFIHELSSAQQHAPSQHIPSSFPVIVDRKNEIATLYGVTRFPTIVLLDHRGYCRNIIVGIKSNIETDLLRQIESLIGKKP